ncbi:LOW QUALITY PROTEIN: LETM1 domain-containing protein 1-like [Colossoma macropomum]|uniref:LOW QUALITY PROTEIN: LETM1 domain-containing protein 1-like n=1 Tax=Colossoma macropomum TaxID=42526 RepID=UPI001864563E|nr:LOW QUALITY PROTEIN: LETM1 domain-containing protein 1-like [Colossoma macropomum]
MFRLCQQAVFVHKQRSGFGFRLYFPSCSSYSTSQARLGVLQRVSDKYERFLEQQFPRFYILYHTLRRGFQLLFEDVKEVRRIKRIMRSNNIHHRELPYRDMERLILFRRDMIKAVPLVVISLPPFAIGLVFVLMCLFPRQLLFRHFWTPQQQRKFQAITHLKRSQHQAEILKNLVWTIPRVDEWPRRTLLLNLCAKIQSGAHPSVSELKAVREVFSGAPLGMRSLVPRHLRSLGSQLPVIVWLPSFLVRRRLTTKALDLLYLDRALDSLGLDQLSDEEMRRACDLRGLNPSHLSSSQCREWLQQWLQFSIQVEESETSLLLHSMAILTLNYPSVPK